MLEGWDVELDNYIFLQVSLYVDKHSMTFIFTRYRKFSKCEGLKKGFKLCGNRNKSEFGTCDQGLYGKILPGFIQPV